jgi:hypothetical protein
VCCIRGGRLFAFLYVISFDILLAGTISFHSIAVARIKLFWMDLVFIYICTDEQTCTQLTWGTFN